MSVAVVYLARFAEGAEPVRKFMQSYKAHQAGAAHDLVAVKKGFPDGGRHEQDDLLHGCECIAIDDGGVDITAYAKAAHHLPHKHVVFFNTFTEIIANDWLAKLLRVIQTPGVGIAAAMGSHESLLSSWTEASRIVWQCNNGRPYDPELEELWGHEIALHAPGWMRRNPTDYAKLFARKLLKRIPKYDQAAADQRFREFWSKQTGGAFDVLGEIPEFPNPHVRSNGFMMEREIFLATRPDFVGEKHKSYLYESGPNGLTASVEKMGLKPIIVGADGEGYSLDNMLHSRTFRLGDQSNLLITDNQSRSWAQMPPKRREMYTRMSWSENVLGPARFPNLPSPYQPLKFSPELFI